MLLVCLLSTVAAAATGCSETGEPPRGPGPNVLLITLDTTLAERLGAKIFGCSVVIELGFLKGRNKLEGRTVHSLVNYQD